MRCHLLKSTNHNITTVNQCVICVTLMTAPFLFTCKKIEPYVLRDLVFRVLRNYATTRPLNHWRRRDARKSTSWSTHKLTALCICCLRKPLQTPTGVDAGCHPIGVDGVTGSWSLCASALSRAEPPVFDFHPCHLISFVSLRNGDFLFRGHVSALRTCSENRLDR